MVFKYCLLNSILFVTVIASELNGDSADYSHEATTTTRRTTKKFSRNYMKHLERKIYLKPNEILVGEAIHELVGKSSEFTKQVTKFENAYRGYLRMEGVKYTFKRDGFWRTWRPVRYPDEKDHAVYYRCMASKDEDDKNADCQKSGYWDIEERLHDCPFEIFAMNNKKHVCGLSFQSIRSQQHCPNELSFDEIRAKCPSTIVTRMRFSKHFDKKHFKASPKALCGGKDSCDITTLYQINSTQILFQIINGNNDIIFSKLMKPNKHNYVCMKSCGNTMGRHLGKDDRKTNSKAKTEIKKSTKVKIKTNLIAKPKIMTKTIKLSKKTGKPLIRSKRAAQKYKIIKLSHRREENSLPTRARITQKGLSKSKIEPKSKARKNSKIKSKPKAEAKLNTQATLKSESKSKTEAKPKIKARSNPKTTLKTEANPKIELKSNTKTKLKAEANSKTEAKSRIEVKPNTKAISNKEAKLKTEANSKTESKSKIEAKPKTKAMSNIEAKLTPETKSKLKATTNYSKYLGSKKSGKIIKREAKSTKNIAKSRKHKKTLKTSSQILRNAKNKKSNNKRLSRPKRNIQSKELKEKYSKHKKATEKKKMNLKEYKPDHRNRNIMAPELKKYFDKLDIKKQKKYGGEDSKHMKSYIKRYLEVHPFFNN